MTTVYEPAPEVEELVKEVAEAHHEKLLDAPLVVLFRSPPAKKNGRERMASVRAVGGLAGFLAGPVWDLRREVLGATDKFYVLEVAKDHWPTLNPDQQRALIDHELCHIDWAGIDEPLKIQAHDLEEFTAVVARHGLWRTDLYDLVAAGAQQLQFNIEELDDGDSPSAD